LGKVRTAPSKLRERRELKLSALGYEKKEDRDRFLDEWQTPQRLAPDLDMADVREIRIELRNPQMTLACVELREELRVPDEDFIDVFLMENSQCKHPRSHWLS
jgi:hypothetical protein